MSLAEGLVELPEGLLALGLCMVTTFPKCEKCATKSAVSIQRTAMILSLRRSDHVLRSVLDREFDDEVDALEEEEAAAVLCAEEDVGLPRWCEEFPDDSTAPLCGWWLLRLLLKS